MKKILLMATAAILMLLTSCQKEYLTTNEYITNNYYQAYNSNTVTINVDAASWVYSGEADNNYFVATIDMPEITKDVLECGVVKMYRVFNCNTNDFSDLANATQMEMPFSRHNETQTISGDWAFFTETVDYEISQGKIQIFYTASDFDYEIDLTFSPEPMKFRCVILK